MSRSVASSDVFHAVAKANRRVILDTLRYGEQSVGSLVEATGLSYSLMSQHLQVLWSHKPCCAGRRVVSGSTG